MDCSLITSIFTDNNSYFQFVLVPWVVGGRSCCDMVLILKRFGKLILNPSVGHPTSLRSSLWS